jgi:leucyl/phenylalanyl-tRNA--protein transferase
MLHVIDPRRAGDSEIVGIGGDFDLGTLVWAYRHGIFPWPADDMPLLWYCPPQRAILRFSRLHVPRSLAKERQRTRLTFSIDRDFDAVIDACRDAPRPGQAGTWITDDLSTAYKKLHRLGHAHSVEAWTEDGAMAGGLYGVNSGGVFSGESMFRRVPYASKLALLHLIDHLASSGLDWIDIQTMTAHMQALGAEFVCRDDFLDLAEQTRALGRKPFASGSSR